MRKPSSRAFTLVELAVSMGVMLVAGGMLLTATRTISLLGAKNGAINLTHQQTRELIHKAVHQIHTAVAIPGLATTTLTSVSGNGPAAGVTYQTLVGGPCRIWANVTAGTKTVVISASANGAVPQVGMRLIIPAFRVEEDITAVATASGVHTVTLANSINSNITSAKGVPNYLVYFTRREALVVVGDTLRYYPQVKNGTYSTVATNITSTTPFSVPAGDNRFVQATFTVRDPRVTGLNLRSMDTTIDLTVPYRCRLTTRQ